jgi:GxxExxY protein
MDMKELTYTINGAIYEVNRQLGSGFLEKVYESALLIELHERGLKAERQVPISVNYKGNIVGEYLVDIIVEGKVLLELKSIVDLDKVHEAQIINYLKATGLPVGLLVNFTYPKAKIKRFFNSTDESTRT